MLDFRKRTRTSNAGNASATEFVAFAGIEVHEIDACLPSSVGRAGGPAIAGDIRGVHNLKGSYGCPYRRGSNRLLRIADNDIGDGYLGTIGRRRHRMRNRYQAGDVELIVGDVCDIQGVVISV